MVYFKSRLVLCTCVFLPSITCRSVSYLLLVLRMVVVTGFFFLRARLTCGTVYSLIAGIWLLWYCVWLCDCVLLVCRRYVVSSSWCWLRASTHVSLFSLPLLLFWYYFCFLRAYSYVSTLVYTYAVVEFILLCMYVLRDYWQLCSVCNFSHFSLFQNSLNRVSRRVPPQFSAFLPLLLLFLSATPC